MDKSDKRRAKHPSAQASSLIAKYRNASDNEFDNCRKCRQANDLPMAHERNERRQSNPSSDPSATYCCTTDSYRPRRHHGMSSVSRTKYLVPQLPEEPYRGDNKNLGALRSLRSHLLANNFAVVRKNRYKEEPDKEEESKYADDPELAGDDNADEENREDAGNGGSDESLGHRRTRLLRFDSENDLLKSPAEENCDDASEFEGKDYDDEDEGEYELDEESDALERQVDRLRIHRKTRTEPPLRGHQRIGAVEPSLHHRALKNLPAIAPARYCRTAAERDTADVPTEDDDEESDVREAEPPPMRKSAWRCPTSRQERETWNQSRNFVERYAEVDRTTLGQPMQNRRPRTTRPEVETSTRSAQIDTVRNRKCGRCVASSAPKTTSSRNAACRLQDARYFVRETNGDEGEGLDDPEPPTMYRAKQRKSKEYRSPIYDPREETGNLDAEIGAIYKSSRSKNSRESSNVSRERTKHSVRAISRHDPSAAAAKHENRHWAQ